MRLSETSQHKSWALAIRTSTCHLSRRSIGSQSLGQTTCSLHLDTADLAQTELFCNGSRSRLRCIPYREILPCEFVWVGLDAGILDVHDRLRGWEWCTPCRVSDDSSGCIASVAESLRDVRGQDICIEVWTLDLDELKINLFRVDSCNQALETALLVFVQHKVRVFGPAILCRCYCSTTSPCLSPLLVRFSRGRFTIPHETFHDHSITVVLNSRLRYVDLLRTFPSRRECRSNGSRILALVVDFLHRHIVLDELFDICSGHWKWLDGVLIEGVGGGLPLHGA